MYKKLLVLAVVILALLFALPESAYAAEECKRDHTDQKNFAFIGSCTDMKCFDCDYIWKNVISFHTLEPLPDGIHSKCTRCGETVCSHPSQHRVYTSCTTQQCTLCGASMAASPKHDYQYSSDGQHTTCSRCNYLSAAHVRYCTERECEFCGQKVWGGSRTHKYKTLSEENCTFVKECVYCGETVTETTHNYRNYTVNCQTVSRCSRCNDQTVISSPRHSYQISGANYVCKICKYIKPGAPHEHTGISFCGFVICNLCDRFVLAPQGNDFIIPILIFFGLIFILLVFIFAFRMRGSRQKKPPRFRKRVPNPSDPASVYWSLVSNEPDIVPDSPTDE